MAAFTTYLLKVGCCDLYSMSLIGPDLEMSILRMVLQIEALFVIRSHHSLYILQWEWPEVFMGEKFIHKYEAVWIQPKEKDQ